MTRQLPTLPPRIEAIIRQAADEHGVPYADVVGLDTHRAASRVRFEAMYRIRNEIRIAGQPPSLPQIGRWFSRDHTSVLNALRRHEKLNGLSFKNRSTGPAPYRLQLMQDMAEAS